MDMSLQEMFAKANAIKPLLSIAPLEQQLIEMDAPTESKSMLRVLLSLDPEERSSASAILQSEEYAALQEAVRTYRATCGNTSLRAPE